MADEWGETAQERVLDTLYEALLDSDNDDFKAEIFGFIGSHPERDEAIMYIEDPEGNCWEVTARSHGRHKD